MIRHPSLALLFSFFLFYTSSLFAQNQVRINTLLSQLAVSSGKNKVNVLNGLAEEYALLDNDKSVSYASQAAQYAKKIKYKSGFALANRHGGVAFYKKKEYQTALKHLFIALAVEEQLRNDPNRAECLMYLGDVYAKQEYFQQAVKYYIRSLETYEQVGNKKKSIKVLNKIAEAYFESSQYNNALTFSSKSMTVAREIGAKEELRDAGYNLSKIYARAGNFFKAYFYLELYNELKDSLYQENQLFEINKLEQNFLTRQEKLRQEQHERQRLENLRNLQYFGISLFFVFLFGSLFFIKRLPFSLPVPTLKVLIFIALFLTSQFILLLIRPFMEQYTGGLPFFMLVLNGMLGLSLLYFNRYLESKIEKRVVVPMAAKERDRRRTRIRGYKKLITTNKTPTVRELPSRGGVNRNN